MSRERRRFSIGAVLLLGVALAAVSAVSATATRRGGARTAAGGTYRVGWEPNFSFTDGFDPTGEYLSYAWSILTNLMVRPLVGYHHVAGPAGNKLVPDLAVALPSPTNGGKTYTFRLKR